MTIPVAIVGSVVIVQGGLRKSKSTTSKMAGTAWNAISLIGSMYINPGFTSLGSMRLRPQYRIETTTSSGVAMIEQRFLRRKRRGEAVMSAREPIVKVMVANVKPRIVKYAKCQPYASLLQEDEWSVQTVEHLYATARDWCRIS